MDPVHRQADKAPDAVAVDAAGATWTYQEVDEHATRVARHLAGAGLEGRTVAVLVENGPKAPWAIQGVPRAGATVCMLSPRWTPREIVRVLQRLRPAAVLATHETETLAAGSVQAANLVTLDQPTSNRALHIEDLPEHEDPLPGVQTADPHSMLASSGTSGEPQLARFPFHAHERHAEQSADRLNLDQGDRWLSVLDPSHVGGFALWMRAAVMGSTVVPIPGFDAGHVRELVREGTVTHASLVPAMLSQILEEPVRPPDAFRLALIGGASCPRDLLDRAREAGWPIALTYGLTEAASQVATAPPELVRKKPGTVGRPLDQVEVRSGEKDELLVRGPTVMEGYLDSEDPFDEDGWLATGDAGRFDEDGHLWITGRLSDRIVTGGVTVDPAEVEQALSQHPGVQAVAVVGIEDDRWGEIVNAAVVPEQEGTLDAQTLRGFLEDKLSPSKHPRGWAFVDELPRTARGKVDRDGVREHLSG